MLEQKNLHRKAFLSILSLLLAACLTGACAKDAPRHRVSVHQLRLNAESYEHDTVIVKGYLSRLFSEDGGPIFLFATRDDASMRNMPAGVFIDIPGHEASSGVAQCLENFVEVIGVFRESNDRLAGGGLSITDVQSLHIVSKSAGDAIASEQDNGCLKVVTDAPRSAAAGATNVSARNLLRSE